MIIWCGSCFIPLHSSFFTSTCNSFVCIWQTLLWQGITNSLPSGTRLAGTFHWTTVSCYQSWLDSGRLRHASGPSIPACSMHFERKTNRSSSATIALRLRAQPRTSPWTRHHCAAVGDIIGHIPPPRLGRRSSGVSHCNNSLVFFSAKYCKIAEQHIEHHWAI